MSAELRTRLGDSFAYGTWLCDAAGQTQHLSQSFLDLLDMTMEEAAGLGWTSRLAPEDLDPMLHAWQATVQQGTAWSRVYRLRDGDGAFRPVLSRGGPIKDDTGAVIAWGGIHLDVSETHFAGSQALADGDPAKEALKEMLEPVCAYRALRDEHGDIHDFEVRYLNTAAMAGKRAAVRPRVGHRLGDLFPSKLRLPLIERCARVVNTREPMVIEDFECDGPESEGQERRIFDVHLAPLDDGLVATWIDVTHRREHERDLEEFWRRYELVARATNDVIWDWDFRTGRVRWNQALTQMMGYHPAEVDPEPMAWWFERIHPEDRERILASLNEAIDSGAERWTGEYRFRTANAGWAEILDRGYIDREPGGAAKRMIGAMRDVTERRAGERERAKLLALEQEARAEAEHAVQDREHVLAAVSHDLRGPLGAIAMAASMLIDETLPKQLRTKQGAVIERSLTHALKLIEDLLDASRLRSGHMLLKRSSELPAELIADAMAMTESVAEQKQVSLTAARMPDLPGVYADRRRLLQVLCNIIGNAIRHTPAGGTVTVSAAPADDGRIRFDVADTGPGITTPDPACVFDRFWRGEERGEGGAGLGLSIAKGLVEAHDGRIGVESPPDQGARFWFEIPVAKSSVR